MEKPNKPRKNRADRSADEKAEASLRKRGLVWWTHFGFKGQFFRFSLGTSDRSRAKRQAKKLIALAEAGKISAVAKTPAERSDRRSASLKRSHTDPKVSAATTRAIKRRWKKFSSKKDRKAHGAAIRDSVTSERRRELSETTTALWKDHGYRKRQVTAQTKRWSDKSERKAQSRRLLAAGEKLSVQENRKKGRLKAARNLLRRRGILKPAGTPGRKATPTQEKDFFKIGFAIEMSIQPALREDKKAIEEARTAYSVREHMPRKLCGTYHRRYKAKVLANPSLIPDGASR
jgi:hypothetical protein